MLLLRGFRVLIAFFTAAYIQAIRRPNMGVITLILLAFAFVSFVLAAFLPSPPARPNLGWLGLAFWVAAELLGRAVGH